MANNTPQRVHIHGEPRAWSADEKQAAFSRLSKVANILATEIGRLTICDRQAYEAELFRLSDSLRQASPFNWRG